MRLVVHELQDLIISPERTKYSHQIQMDFQEQDSDIGSSANYFPHKLGTEIEKFCR